MISYEIYKVVHLAGIFMILVAYGALLLNGMQNQGRKLACKFPSITHGMGLVMALVGGFGLLVRIGVSSPWPLWVWLKLAIWLFYGLASPFIRKSPQMARRLWFVIIGLGILAAYLANFKP